MTTTVTPSNISAPEFLTRDTIQDAIPRANNPFFRWIEYIQDLFRRGYSGTLKTNEFTITFTNGIVTRVTAP